MKVLKVESKEAVDKLRFRLLRRGMVVAEVGREDDLKKDFVKKAHVVLYVERDVSPDECIKSEEGGGKASIF
jgi:hypothetical protein